MGASPGVVACRDGRFPQEAAPKSAVSERVSVTRRRVTSDGTKGTAVLVTGAAVALKGPHDPFEVFGG